MPLYSIEQERGRRQHRRCFGGVTASDRAGDYPSSQGRTTFSAEGRRCGKLSPRCKAPVWFKTAPKIDGAGQEPEEEADPRRTLNAPIRRAQPPLTVDFLQTLHCPRQALTAPSSRGLPDQRQMSPGDGKPGAPEAQLALKPMAWAAARVPARILSAGPVVSNDWAN